MTKRPAQFKDAFKRGLRQNPDPKNQDRLARSYNAKPSPVGLMGWTEIPQVVGQSSVDFPFPQLLMGREKLILAYDDNLSYYDPQTGIETALSLIDAYTLNASTISSGGVWHLCDFGRMFIATNGTSLVFRDNSDFLYQDTNIAKVTQDVQMNSIASWRGRVMSGGLTLNWKAGWQTIFEAFRNNDRMPDALRSMPYAIDEGYVLWSTVGTADFSFRWLLYPAEATSGLFAQIDGQSIDGYSGDKTPLQEALLRAELGMRKMPFKGAVLCVKPHALGFVVYCENGIALLKHEQSPFSTFGLRELSSVGIAGRGTVGGTEDRQLYVDATGKLNLLDSTGKITSLDYQEFFQPLLSETIVVSYHHDDLKPEFYISTATKNFVLTVSGLGESFQLITSTGKLNGSQVVVAKHLPERRLLVEISEYDGGLAAGLKQVQVCRVSANRPDGLLGYSQVSYGQGRAFSQTRPRLFSPEGFLRLGDTSSVSRLCIEADEPADLLIQQLDTEVDFISKQIVRSPYGQEVDQ